MGFNMRKIFILALFVFSMDSYGDINSVPAYLIERGNPEILMMASVKAAAGVTLSVAKGMYYQGSTSSEIKSYVIESCKRHVNDQNFAEENREALIIECIEMITDNFNNNVIGKQLIFSENDLISPVTDLSGEVTEELSVNDENSESNFMEEIGLSARAKGTADILSQAAQGSYYNGGTLNDIKSMIIKSCNEISGGEKYPQLISECISYVVNDFNSSISDSQIVISNE